MDKKELEIKIKDLDSAKDDLDQLNVMEEDIERIKRIGITIENTKSFLEKIMKEIK